MREYRGNFATKSIGWLCMRYKMSIFTDITGGNSFE